jgi:SulP family sulfate permease
MTRIDRIWHLHKSLENLFTYPFSREFCLSNLAQVPLEITAGIAFAAFAIPEVMGYTKIAGMPLVTGIYPILLPVVAFAIFGSSRHLVPLELIPQLRRF